MVAVSPRRRWTPPAPEDIYSAEQEEVDPMTALRFSEARQVVGDRSPSGLVMRDALRLASV